MKIGKTGFQRKYAKKGKSPKTALFQQSKDLCGAQTRNRTKDTGIFSPLLYLLSYLGKYNIQFTYNGLVGHQGLEPRTCRL